MVDSNRTYELPVLPVKNTVGFPYVIVPYVTDLPRSMAAIDYALSREDKTWPSLHSGIRRTTGPACKSLYSVGTSGVVRL
jgi:ATP-dependent Lon protease